MIIMESFYLIDSEGDDRKTHNGLSTSGRIVKYNKNNRSTISFTSQKHKKKNKITII